MHGFTTLRNAFLMLIFGCAVVWGQATAQISGTVRDQSGAVLPGVEITATQTDKQYVVLLWRASLHYVLLQAAIPR